jgi:hypothetical protein
MAAFVDTMQSSTQATLEELMAKFFFGCNIPFSVCESQHFKAFVNALRPSFKIPSRRTLSGPLLDRVYNSMQAVTGISASSVLLVDGWKNEANNTKNVATILHNVSGETGTAETVFLEAWDISGEAETGEKLLELLEEATDLAKTRHNTDIYCTVSDSAANMMKMGRLSEHWHVPCNSHQGNLLAKSLMPTNVASRVTQVLKAFKQTDRQKELLDYGGSRVALPCDTRWGSQRDACDSLKKNLQAMRRVAADDEVGKLSSAVKSLLFDTNFLSQVDDTLALLDPATKLINVCQTKTSNIADAAQQWLQLNLPEGYESLKQVVEDRKKKALQIYGLTANVLHPEYQGKLLNTTQLDDVEGFILSNLDDAGIESYRSYSEKSGTFAELLKKKLSARTFWFFARRHHASLSQLALKLHNIPASSAQLERVFSNWSYVHNATRNRLSFDHSKKLVHVYYACKIRDQKSDEY